MPDIKKINALAELERLGWKMEPAGEEEYRCLCPVHEDRNPSVQFNVDKNLWNCKTCGAKGDVISFIAHATKSERKNVLADLGERYDLSEVRQLRPDTIEKWHQAIWSHEHFLKELHNRGISDTIIRKRRLGVHNGRITIPIYDIQGRIVNVRRYLPGAPGPQKMRSTRGYRTMALYLPEQTRSDKIWICGGELKAAVAAHILNEEGIGAVAVTAGEGNWDSSFNSFFKDKQVWICLDVDEQGERASKLLARYLAVTASRVKIIRLPLNKEEHPKGDINDWVAEGASLDDFLKAMRDAEDYVHEADEEGPLVPVETSFSELGATHLNKYVTFDTVFAGVEESREALPVEVKVECEKDQQNCAFCPVFPKEPDEDGLVPLSIRGKAPTKAHLVYLEPGKGADRGLSDMFRIPECKTCKIHEVSHINSIGCVLEDPEKDASSRKRVIGHILSEDNDTLFESSSTYAVSGRVVASDRDRSLRVLIDEFHATENNLTQFKITKDELAEFDVFRPKSWTPEAIQDSLDVYYQDMASNVTKIYNRQDMHLAIDLTFHSLLYIPFEGRNQNGWMNTILLGDSSQGKTEASTRLSEHYGLGEVIDCKAASFAGVIGGVQSFNKKWFILWGTIPRNDRRLAILEELKGLSTEEIAQMTHIRSTGVANITKVISAETPSRTRLLMISNPRGRRSIAEHTYGIEAILPLVGTPEDVRRTDLVVISARGEADTNPPGPSEHVFKRQLCRRRTLWAWSLQPEQIRVECGKNLRTLSNKLTEVYDEAIPVVDEGSMRFKMLRMASALAVMTASIEEGSLVVRDCHAEYIYEYLDRVYSSPACGYKERSTKKNFYSKVPEYKVVEKRIRMLKHPKSFVEFALQAESVDVNDISLWAGIDRETASELMSFLVRKRCLQPREGRGRKKYTNSEGFLRLLKNLTDLEDGIPGIEDEF